MKSVKFVRHFIMLMLIALAIAFLCFHFLGSLADIPYTLISDMSKILISLYATLLGFLFTMLAIIASVIGNKFIKALIESGHYDNLINSSIMLATLYFIAIICSMGALFESSFQILIFVYVLSVSILIIFFSVRTAFKFFQVLKYLGRQ